MDAHHHADRTRTANDRVHLLLRVAMGLEAWDFLGPLLGTMAMVALGRLKRKIRMTPLSGLIVPRRFLDQRKVSNHHFGHHRLLDSGRIGTDTHPRT